MFRCNKITINFTLYPAYNKVGREPRVKTARFSLSDFSRHCVLSVFSPSTKRRNENIHKYSFPRVGIESTTVALLSRLVPLRHRYNNLAII